MAIICIAGLSGTGKSTLAKEISKIKQIPLAISCTTRPMRPNEKDGVDYHFISDEEYVKLANDNKLVAKEEYLVAGGFIWKYGFKSDDIKKNKFSLTVINPKGIDDLKKDGIQNVISILIKVDEEERINRIKKRSDNQSKEEIERRTLKDIEIFAKHKFNYIVHNDNFDECLTKILRIIELEKKRENYKNLDAWIIERFRMQKKWKKNK